MGILRIGERFYCSFKWKGHRIRTVTGASNATQAKKIDGAVRIAFKIGNFGHLAPDALDVVVRTYENKGWALPPELAPSQPEEELTLLKAVKEYLEADPKYRSERNLYAIDRIVEHFGESRPLRELKVADIRAFQRARARKVENGTVNRELGVLSGIFRVQVEKDELEINPCSMVKRLPERQRDSYLSWVDFVRLRESAGWISDLLTMMYFTGMRFGEVVALRWEMFKPERRMMVVPPGLTKEGKNMNAGTLKAKRVPLRREVMEMLERRRMSGTSNVVRVVGLVFTYEGRYCASGRIAEEKAIVPSMVRKAWMNTLRASKLDGLQMRDLRHTWKTNALRSGMDRTIRNLIVGHSSQRSVEDRYIRASDEDLLLAVDSMVFDKGRTELNEEMEG